MAATTGIGPIKQALVRALRDNLTLKAMVGSEGINEGTEPRGTDYPHVVYSVAYSTREWDGTNVTIVVELDVWSVSDSQVEAHNLDQLVAEALEEKILDLDGSSGQTSLLCRRFGDLSSLDIDGAGNRVYQVGGLYRIWTDQQRTA
jgi:hypothetical protein